MRTLFPYTTLFRSERMAPDLAQLQLRRPALRAMYAELMADYPQHVRESLVDAHVSDDWLQAGSVERGNLVVLAEELRAGPGIPDVPLVALTTEGIDSAQQALTSQRSAEQTVREMVDGRMRMVEALVNAVSHGERRVVSDVGHSQLCFQRADVVVQAIRDVVDRAARA